MSLLYVMPFMRAPAFIFMLHRVRRTRFFFRLSLKRCTPACSNASRAARSFDFLPQRNPFVCFKTFRRRFTEMVPRLTRVISFYAIYRLVNSLAAFVKATVPFLFNSVARDFFARK